MTSEQFVRGLAKDCLFFRRQSQSQPQLHHYVRVSCLAYGAYLRGMLDAGGGQARYGERYHTLLEAIDVWKQTLRGER